MNPTFADVVSAAERIRDKIHRTPVVTSNRLNELAGCELFLKCENLQKTGAFKARGAVNAVFSLDESSTRAGVATHSSGNHGAALARAAQLRGIDAHIVVPRNAKAVKKAAIAAYGGRVIECEPILAAREALLAQVVIETGARVIHPYDDNDIVSGQGTAALELIEQVTALDSIVVPIGGGGLIAGTCLVAAEHSVDVIGAEPTGADDTFRSLRDGRRFLDQVPSTICDGLLTTVGELNFDVIQQHVQQILLADDKAVINAMELIWSRTKLIVEPSSAIALAVVIQNPAIFANQRIGLMMTGGNVDLAALPFTS